MNDLERTFNAVIKAKSWLDQANCRNMDTEIFFPTDGENVSSFVKEVCNECPVTKECLWYANESYSTMGVFAGLGARARQDWRTKNKISLGMTEKEWEENKYRGILRRPIGGTIYEHAI